MTYLVLHPRRVVDTDPITGIWLASGLKTPDIYPSLVGTLYRPKLVASF